jgi:hypothetical protein
MNINKRGKKAGIELSFGMIFSIFLIIVFIVVAIVAVNQILKLKRCSDINFFAQDLQEQADELWKSSKGSVVFSAPLTTKIEYVCIANLSKPASVDEEIYNELKRNYKESANLYFYPQKNACGSPFREISHIDISGLENPYCIKNTGKPEIRLEKDFFDSLVKIKD